MIRLHLFRLTLSTRQSGKWFFLSVLFGLFLVINSTTLAEGTKQLEPTGVPSNSYCKLVLLQNKAEFRIPFALFHCAEEYRLNIHINDFNSEKIYFAFGDVIDYFYDTVIYHDVSYLVLDPDGNIVAGDSTHSLPSTGAGHIDTRTQAEAGPDINGQFPGGYKPLVITPARNGDYYIEFKIPPFINNQIRTFKYFDVTVARNNFPVNGRLWSKAWQLGSGSITSDKHASYSKFYIYTNDSIVTRFDCNGMAGGVWDIYCNEWGCATNGAWNDRRQSITGNATVQPEYKIFLNDPDIAVFPTGHIGKLNEFKVLREDCDTVIAFAANVSKAGIIEIMIDVPPISTGYFGSEDVQLTAQVTPGENIQLPTWNGRNGHGIPVENGTQVKIGVRYLNGLTNLPLYDVEDNPNGFKVDIQRPGPVSGSTKLKLFWDDTRLPADKHPTSNITEGCIYSGSGVVSGCHAWMYTANQSIGDTNTLNTWWYLTTDDSLASPITLKIRPSSGLISGPATICSGQPARFFTSTIDYAKQYVWHLSGPGVESDTFINSPDTGFLQMFPASLAPGYYILSVFGRNPRCWDGNTVHYSTYVYDYIPPPLSGPVSVCVNSTSSYQLQGSFSKIHWSSKNGEIVGSADANPVSVVWHASGSDSLQVTTATTECGTRTSNTQINVHPVPAVAFSLSGPSTACPGMQITCTDKSQLEFGSIISRYWDWGNGQSYPGNDTVVTYSFPATGTFPVKLKVATGFGCQSEAIQQIRIIPYPQASYSYYRNCVSQVAQFSDNSSGIDLASRRWDFGSASAINANPGLQQQEAVFSTAGQFPVKLVISNQYGCADSITKSVSIHHLPKAAFGYELACQNTSTIFTDKSTSADTIITGYSWVVQNNAGMKKSYSGNPALLVFDSAANFKVSLIATDGYGCSDSVGSIVNIKPRPDSEFDYIENAGNKPGTLHFNNLSTGAEKYYWDFGNSTYSMLDEPEITYNREGNYTIELVAASSDGCTDTATKQYYYMPGLWMPNAFTPGNNGHNDVFRPVTQRTTLDPYHFTIFNRWGQAMFTTSNPAEGWDGNYQGKPCPEGNYTYLVEYRENKPESTGTIEKRGIVTLIR